MEETNLILMDLRNKNSPLYNFLKAKNLMVLELNHSNSSMRKSNMSYQPSKKAKNKRDCIKLKILHSKGNYQERQKMLIE